MSTLVYSSRFVRPKIISIMDKILEDNNAILQTRVVRTSKNKTKILNRYKIFSKSNKQHKEYSNKDALLNISKLFSKEFSQSVLS